MLKAKLLEYNRDDCLALRLPTEFMVSIKSREVEGEPEPLRSDKVVYTSELLSTMAGKRRFGKAKFCLPDLEFVNRCAYFDYQRDRVYVRTKKRAGAAKSRPTLRGPRRVKVNKRVEVRCKRRPHCNSRRLSEGRVLSAHYRHEVLSKRREEVGDFLILVAVPLR